jgi:hypothetical protein
MLPESTIGMLIGVERLLLAWILVAVALAVIAALGELEIAELLDRMRGHRAGARSDA